MRYLKLFEGFNSEDIDSICRKWDIEDYIINEDGTIDVDGNVDLSFIGLTKLPLKFRSVSGDFYCYNNQLTTLEGGPKEVRGNFYCDNNQLKSLEGGPKTVGGGFSCENNQLTTLEGCPQLVGGGFWCSNNKLKTLEGIGKVSGDIYCENWVTNLEHNPCSVIYEEWINTDRREMLLDLMEDYDFLRGAEIYWERLEAFYKNSGLEIPDREELEKYYTIIE